MSNPTDDAGGGGVCRSRLRAISVPATFRSVFKRRRTPSRRNVVYAARARTVVIIIFLPRRRTGKPIIRQLQRTPVKHNMSSSSSPLRVCREISFLHFIFIFTSYPSRQTQTPAAHNIRTRTAFTVAEISDVISATAYARGRTF